MSAPVVRLTGAEIRALRARFEDVAGRHIGAQVAGPVAVVTPEPAVPERRSFGPTADDLVGWEEARWQF